MSNWFRRGNNKPGKALDSLADAATPSSPPAGGEVYENAASTIVFERKMQHWLDEAIRDCERSGGLDHLDGKGKPVEVPSGDGLNSILKNANVLPSWLELQHEIRDDIRALLRRYDSVSRPPSFHKELDAINQKIRKYNMSVPTPILQKGRLFPETVQKQLQVWE